MPRKNVPTPVRQRYFESWTYDAHILAAALLVALPGALLIGLLLAWRDIPEGLLATSLGVGVLLTLGFAYRLRNPNC